MTRSIKPTERASADAAKAIGNHEGGLLIQ